MIPDRPDRSCVAPNVGLDFRLSHPTEQSNRLQRLAPTAAGADGGIESWNGRLQGALLHLHQKSQCSLPVLALLACADRRPKAQAVQAAAHLLHSSQKSKGPYPFMAPTTSADESVVGNGIDSHAMGPRFAQKCGRI